MNLAISQDAEFLARVWNHPKVKPWVALGNPELLTQENAEKLLSVPGAVFLTNEFGGFLLIPAQGDIYDLHTNFMPEGRGPKLLELAKEGEQYMFTRTPCVVIRTFVPENNAGARKFALRGGFVEVGEAEFNGFKGAMYLLTIKKWVMDLCQPQSL